MATKRALLSIKVLSSGTRERSQYLLVSVNASQAKRWLANQNAAGTVKSVTRDKSALPLAL